MSQTRLISVRKSEPNQIVVYNLDRKNRTEIPARENTGTFGTVQLSDPSEPVRSSPGSWPHDSGDAYKSITDLRNFQSWRRSMQPEAMLDLQTIRHTRISICQTKQQNQKLRPVPLGAKDTPPILGWTVLPHDQINCQRHHISKASVWPSSKSSSQTTQRLLPASYQQMLRSTSRICIFLNRFFI